MRTRRLYYPCLLSLFSAATTFAAPAPVSSMPTDWPAFRGPVSSGASSNAEIPAQPKVAWSAKLPGRGLSSPVIVGERVFVTAAEGAEQERLRVLCFRAKDGAALWERQLLATGRTMTHAKTCVAANTPCSDGKHVFALWSSNDLAAFDFEGNLLWLRGLTADYTNASNSLGMASSPVTVGGTLVVQIENDSESYALGIDVNTGKNLWKLQRPKFANWTSPVPLPARAGLPAAVLLHSKEGVCAVDAANGKILWQLAGNASTMSSGVALNDAVYIPVSGMTALSVPTVGVSEPQTLWNARQINPSTTSPLLLQNRLFTLNNAGILTMAEVAGGDIKWKLRLTGPFSGSPVGAGERIVLINEKALLQVVNAAAPEGEVIGQLQLPLDPATKELTLCTPALSGGSVFVRTDSTLWCISQ
jgi:outer membrane protein assembly factor BamB